MNETKAVALTNFGEVLKAIKKGKHAHRACWEPGVHIEYIPEHEDKIAHTYTLETIAVTLWSGRRVVGWNNTTEDLFAEDWVIE